MEKCDVQSIRISDFLNTDVKDYAMYVLRTRALPSVMDGMRIGARKILWAGLNGPLKKPGYEIKMPSFIGQSMSYHYNHGDTSIKNTIEQLAYKHVIKYCPFHVIGQIESLFSGKVNTAARYLQIESTPELDLFKYDMELLEHQTDEGDKIEPKYLLPILPMLLLYRTNSPGFGFSYRCMSYTLDSIIDNMILAITSGSCYLGDTYIQLQPEINEIKSENLIYNWNKEQWYNVGEYVLDFETDVMVITALPYNTNLPAYDEHLNGLAEKGIIKSFADSSKDDKIHYKIQFYPKRLKMMFRQDKMKFFKTFKLVTSIPKDIINVIDTNGDKILFFEDAYQYIDYFVKLRLNVYKQRKEFTILEIEKELVRLDGIIRFIMAVVNGELEIRNRPIAEIKAWLSQAEISEDVLKIAISKVTKDEIVKHQQTIQDLKDKLEYIKSTPIEELYINELIEIKQKYSVIETPEI